MVALPFVCAEIYASVNKLLVYPFDDRYDTVAIIEGVAGLVGVVAASKCSIETPISLGRHANCT
jgi:hypothetical protein